MNILYISCHESLEYYELSVFNKLGHDFMSLGAYKNPNQPINSPRPAISHQTKYMHPNIFNDDLIDWSDIIIIMHDSPYLQTCLDSHPNVIIRTIGQNAYTLESKITKLKKAYTNLRVIRYSEKEMVQFPDMVMDGCIYFGIDSGQFNNWSGTIPMGLNVTQGLGNRGEICRKKFVDMFKYQSNRLDIYDRSGYTFPLSFEELIDRYRLYRFYLYTGTYPAPYTLSFIEAMMIGIPIIALDNTKNGHINYEIPDFIDNEQNGFLVSNVEEALYYANKLMEDYDYAKKISENARQYAYNRFNQERVIKEWEIVLQN